ncbi:hypothetical protein HJ588_06100 [Flexivirga sp. ID2601S]|uniref:Uncharacterized protein n=1 Tax=Flexivirga aerilata TaxID=1656889 RepID=A0A849AG43_9MICO|nr:hypothetical protein [Flexivirga aerilata]NNG38847.1 hypothetical protein [Flexivirga aerilata]
MPEPPKPTDAASTGRPAVVRRRVRRTPNFGAFIITGAVVGLIVGMLLAAGGPNQADYAGRTSVALLGGVGAALGALAGAIAGLLLEWLLNRGRD